MGDRVIIYDPKTAKPWRKAVAYEVRKQVDVPLDGPLQLTMCFFFPRPKSHYGTGKNSELLKASAPTYHSQKPDIDNIVKSSLDAMNDVAYGDDKQVVELSATKVWADLHQPCGLALTIDCV